MPDAARDTPANARGRVLAMFDFDGVVADTLECFVESLAGACAEAGVALGGGREGFLRLFDTNMWEGLAAAGVDAAAAARLRGRLQRRLAARVQSCRAFDGMPEALTRLASRHDVVVISSNFSSIVEEFLARAGVAGVTDVAGCDRGTGKVDKIRDAMARRPGRAGYYVGDTRGDMREARRAGVGSVAVSWGWHDVATLRLESPDHVVRAPADLVALFDGIAEGRRHG